MNKGLKEEEEQWLQQALQPCSGGHVDEKKTAEEGGGLRSGGAEADLDCQIHEKAAVQHLYPFTLEVT